MKTIKVSCDSLGIKNLSMDEKVLVSITKIQIYSDECLRQMRKNMKPKSWIVKKLWALVEKESLFLTKQGVNKEWTRVNWTVDEK